METLSQQWIARSVIRINAPVESVWDALINPEMIKQYMFGAEVESTWKEGGQIVWRGEWEGKPYEDHGMIIRMIPIQLLEYKHYGGNSGLPEKQENYHTVTIELKTEDLNQVRVTLTQDNNAGSEEKENSEKNWTMMLQSMKKLLEKKKPDL